ncbi:MAG: hypothetical protein QF475_00850 [Candidatus Undinarchaeales archaeon]|jgi:hypothetical protein|nr:hypothetical protein [Candidatus Undinarchaeales archaeon]
MKKQIVAKDMLKPSLILAGILIVLVVMLFTPAFNTQGWLSLILLSVAIIFSRMFVGTEYGISISYFLFFGIAVGNGVVIGLLVAILTGIAQGVLSTRETPIDFCLRKDVGTAVRQTMRFGLVTIAIGVLSWLRGPNWIMQNLIFVYLGLLIVFWVILYDVPRIVLGTAPIGKVVALVTMSLLINWKLIEIFGVRYITWLGGLI